MSVALPCGKAQTQLHHLMKPNKEWSALETPAMCDSAPFLSPSLPVAYFILTHLLVIMETPNVTDFYHANPPKPSYGHYRRKKKSSHTLRDTELHKTHPWVHCTPFMIYITIRNQRSPSVKNVSWVWKSSSLFFFFFFFLSQMRNRWRKGKWKWCFQKVLDVFLDLWSDGEGSSVRGWVGGTYC